MNFLTAFCFFLLGGPSHAAAQGSSAP